MGFNSGFKGLNTAQHVSGVLMPIIRSLSTAVAASSLPLERGGSSVVGRGRSETCWAVFKWQAIKLRDCCIWLVDLFDLIFVIRFYSSCGFRPNDAGYCDRSQTQETPVIFFYISWAFHSHMSFKRWQFFIQENPTRCNSVSKFIIPYLYEAQHVSGDTPPIIRSLKLH